jgi:hypothetical protein
MEGIAYPNEENLLVVIRLDVVLPKIGGQLLSFAAGSIGIAVKTNGRLIVHCDMLWDVHIEHANAVVNCPLNIALGIINLGKSMEM